MKILFVVNQKSGVQSGTSTEELIKIHAERNGFQYQIYQIKEDAQSHIKKLLQDYNPDQVAAAGGDGTINLLAGLLFYTNIPLLIIPSGSANGMAKELDIISIEQSLNLLHNGIIKSIDLVRINGIVSIHLADIGVNARVVKRFEEDPRRGIITYARHLFGEMFLMKHYRLYITYDGKQIKRKAVSVTFANATMYGTGAVINPHGKLNDGFFELIIVKPFPDIKIFSIAWKMFRNKLHTSDYVEVISCKEARINCNRKTTLQVDGEVIGKIKDFHIQIMHHALKVFVPQPLS
ncbi:MAG: diacylglycerol kinase [Flavobacterium sp.]|nr:diacylglycerol kinase [Pedobacter sp.]